MSDRKSAGSTAMPHSAENTMQPTKADRISSICDILPRGKARAVSMSHLADALRCSDRDVRAVIHRARCDGAIIAGDSSGYYLPETREELIRWYRLAKKRSLSGLKALKSARQQLRELEGQQSIET